MTNQTLSGIRVALILMACLAGAVHAQSKGQLEKDRQLGLTLSRELESRVKLSADPAVLGLADRVAQAIARNADTAIPITVQVIDSPEINVMTLPGGYVYVTRGLIRSTATEAELAFALAQGIAFSVVGHSAAFNGGATFLPANSTTVFTGGVAVAAVQNGLSIGIPTMFYQRSRGAVDEADRLGIQYLYKAGYDPGAAPELLEKVEAISPAKKVTSNLFLTHPLLSERVLKLKAVILKSLPQRDTSIITTDEFVEVHRVLVEEVDTLPEDVPATFPGAPTLRRGR